MEVRCREAKERKIGLRVHIIGMHEIGLAILAISQNQTNFMENMHQPQMRFNAEKDFVECRKR